MRAACSWFVARRGRRKLRDESLMYIHRVCTSSYTIMSCHAAGGKPLVAVRRAGPGGTEGGDRLARASPAGKPARGTEEWGPGTVSNSDWSKCFFFAISVDFPFGGGCVRSAACCVVVLAHAGGGWPGGTI